MSVIIAMAGMSNRVSGETMDDNPNKTTINSVDDVGAELAYFYDLNTGERLVRYDIERNENWHHDGSFTGAEVFTNILAADGSYEIVVTDGNIKHTVQMSTYDAYGYTYDTQLEYFKTEDASALKAWLSDSATYVREVLYDNNHNIKKVIYREYRI